MVGIKIPHPRVRKNICKSEEFSLAKNKQRKKLLDNI
jgi:hypothetical protein